MCNSGVNNQSRKSPHNIFCSSEWILIWHNWYGYGILYGNFISFILKTRKTKMGTLRTTILKCAKFTNNLSNKWKIYFSPRARVVLVFFFSLFVPFSQKRSHWRAATKRMVKIKMQAFVHLKNMHCLNAIVFFSFQIINELHIPKTAVKTVKYSPNLWIGESWIFKIFAFYLFIFVCLNSRS